MPDNLDLMESVETDSLEVPASEAHEEPVSDEPLHTVKVDGEDRQVSQSELLNGYQRQADYTRKTQELAVERERLQQAETIAQALESDPEGTLKALSSVLL